MTELPQAPYVLFLGSHPAISASEVWGVLNRAKLAPELIAIDHRYLILNTNAPISSELFATIGGTDRIGTVLLESESSITIEQAASYLSPPLSGKMTIGISSFGLAKDFGLSFSKDLKKHVKSAGGRMNFVSPKKGMQINTAQILFNDLLTQPNAELTIIKHEETHYLVHTLLAQDIQAYEKRDTSKPARDARVGMLPPKLAQMMLNLATAHVEHESPLTIGDPFCGLGTLLQEGWLMGHQMIGSDVEDRMVQASEANMSHIEAEFPITHSLRPRISQHDAGDPWPAKNEGFLQAVVTEPYLGPPLSKPPSSEEALEHGAKVARLYLRTFIALRHVLAPSGIVLFLLPAIRTSEGRDFMFLPPSLLDEIEAIGYRRIQLVPKELQQEIAGTERGTLLYARPDAIVGRELTLWQRND